MVESQIPAVAKFFYLTTKNPEKINLATQKVLLRLNKAYKKNPDLELDASLLVYWTHYYWKKVQKNKLRLSQKQRRLDKEAQKFLIPDSIDLSFWNQFLRTCKEEEALYLVWSKVLNISDYHIAKGIGLSDGTVRYRIGKSLEKLSQVLEV